MREEWRERGSEGERDREREGSWPFVCTWKIISLIVLRFSPATYFCVLRCVLCTPSAAAVTRYVGIYLCTHFQSVESRRQKNLHTTSNIVCVCSGDALPRIVHWWKATDKHTHTHTQAFRHLNVCSVWDGGYSTSLRLVLSPSTMSNAIPFHLSFSLLNVFLFSFMSFY